MGTKFLKYAVWLILVIALCWSFYHAFGRPMRYEFAEGFKGWLSIRFEDPTCPPLRSQGIFLVVSVPSSGHVCTSTRHPNGWVYYRFEYVHPNDTRTPIPMRSGSDPPGTVQVWLVTYLKDYRWEEAWVGTKEGSYDRGTPPDPWRQKSNSSNSAQP